eukprot:358162-Chlamydomonas_euryale.AAC.11
MGCFGSKARKSASSEADGGRGGYEMGQGVVTVSNGRVVREKPTRDYHKPQWKTEDPAMTKERLAVRAHRACSLRVRACACAHVLDVCRLAHSHVLLPCVSP